MCVLVVKHSSSYKINIKNDKPQGAGLRLWFGGGGRGLGWIQCADS